MNYNVHPLFVHFPIALLTLYSVLELIRFRIIRRQQYWFYIKAVLVIIGAASAWVAAYFGGIAEHMVTDRSIRPLIEMHSNWATITIAIYSILGVAYLIGWAEKIGISWRPLSKLKWLIIETPFVWILSTAGLIALLITGALGGSLVYGPSNDPVTNFIYHLFF